VDYYIAEMNHQALQLPAGSIEKRDTEHTTLPRPYSFHIAHSHRTGLEKVLNLVHHMKQKMQLFKISRSKNKINVND